MRRHRAAVVCCAVLLALVAAIAPSADAAPVEDLVVALNRARADAGVPPLRRNETLVNEAAATAARLAETGSLQIDLDAQELRLRRARYPLRRIASISGAGTSEPDRVVAQYLDHAQTRESLLSLHYSEIGVGLATRPGTERDRVWVITLAEPFAGARPGWRADILEHVNAFRSEHGLPPLVPNGMLDQAAQGHSEDMARRDFFDHTAPDGVTVADRARSAGYAFREVGENIAAGMRRPSRVVDVWIGSPPHRAAMLEPSFQEAGVGYAYDPFDDGNDRSVHYWTLKMGRR